MIHLVQHEADWPVSGRMIAERAAIPAKYLSKILGDLVRVGVLESSPGKAGGFKLRRPAKETMLREVLTPFEQFEHGRCPFGSDDCSDETPCLAHEGWKEVVGSRDRFLRETSVYDIAVRSPGGLTQASSDGE